MGKVILARRYARGANSPSKVIIVLLMGVIFGGCLGYGLMSKLLLIYSASRNNVSCRAIQCDLKIQFDLV
jgi:hypothetical protein